MHGSQPRDPAPSCLPTSTTPPQTRKRKAIEALEESFKTKKQSTVERDCANTTSSIATPPLTAMDSDDEFMSGISSQDEGFGDDQESDDGSLGDGTYLRAGHTYLRQQEG